MHSQKKFWQISPGRKERGFWPEFLTKNIIAIGWDDLGDLRRYSSIDALEKEINKRWNEGINSARSCWFFSRDIKEKDIVVAKHGASKEIYGIGKVTKEYSFKKERKIFKHVIGVHWYLKFDDTIKVDTSKEFVRWTAHSLSEARYLEIKKSIVRDYPEQERNFQMMETEENGTELPYLTISTGVRADLRMFDQSFVSEFEKLLQDKKQIILFGPPGTSKTFFALQFSKYMTGDRSRFHLVQFHPSYSYEDFVEGIIAKTVGGQVEYEVTPRIFRRMCSEAENSDKPYVLIIDEINRGNLAKIFGELIFSLEYRDHEVTLPYSSESLCIPQSLCIIGTMNSADRSIALVDYALRRRFYFVEMLPSKTMLGFWLDENKVEIKDKVIEIFSIFNRKIRENEKLGKHFQLGHTYFFVKDVDELKRNWKYAIRPLLEEYFFGDEEELRTFENDFNRILGE